MAGPGDRLGDSIGRGVAPNSGIADPELLAQRLAGLVHRGHSDFETLPDQTIKNLSDELFATPIPVKDLYPVFDRAHEILNNMIKEHPVWDRKRAQKTLTLCQKVVDDWMVWERKRDRFNDLADELHAYREHGRVPGCTSKVGLLGRVLSVMDEMSELGKFLEHDEPDSVGEAREAVRALLVDAQREEALQRREEHIAARKAARQEPAPQVTPRCSVCGKKPAKIDGMCKPCLRASGVIIHGKVGEE